MKRSLTKDIFIPINNVRIAYEQTNEINDRLSIIDTHLWV